MNRQAIIHQIKLQCTSEYLKITDWVHDIHHIRTVVAYGKRLSQMEKLSATNTMLVELACWLHDLGRTQELVDHGFGKSMHAEISYQMSKQLLVPFRKQLGTEGIYKLLQAVREHNLPCLLHPENVVARVLVDADRGSGIRVDGIYKMLAFRHTIDWEPVYTQVQARLSLDDLAQTIIKEKKVDLALIQIGYLKNWYYGTKNQIGSGVEVAPLYTDSAKKLFKNGVREIEAFEKNLKLEIRNLK